MDKFNVMSVSYVMSITISIQISNQQWLGMLYSSKERLGKLFEKKLLILPTCPVMTESLETRSSTDTMNVPHIKAFGCTPKNKYRHERSDKCGGQATKQLPLIYLFEYFISR